MFKFKYRFSLLFILFILFSCKNDLEEIKALTNQKELPDVTVENLRSQYSINGHTQIVLSTPLAYRYTNPKKEYSVFPEGITLTFYDKHMNIHSSLRADYGIYYEKKNFAKAEGNVILTNVKGSILKTEELFLNEKTEKIYSVKPVNIVDKSGFEITGEGGFESNLDFTVYRFTNVTGKIIKDDDEGFINNDNKQKNNPNKSKNKKDVRLK
ncbi:MAG: LPS export ABC transporter periplasmic protein LptC [Bacteroidales bacterium]|nr:LPS export ABC transporter periplasmic protein LptC [Bacteroidales bacterium]